jgi:hypothetical protein
MRYPETDDIVARAYRVPCAAVHPADEICMVCAPHDGEYRCVRAYYAERLTIARGQLRAERAAYRASLPWWLRILAWPPP